MTARQSRNWKLLAGVVALGIATLKPQVIRGQTPAAPRFADRTVASVPAPRFVSEDVTSGDPTKCGKLTLPPGTNTTNSAGADVPLGLDQSQLDPSTILRFSSVSVSPVSDGRFAVIKRNSARIEYSNFRLRSLILQAYPVAECQIFWPSWLQYDLYYGWPGGNVGSDRVPEAPLINRFGPFYDVTGTFPAGTTEVQQQLMLRALLADRFKLVLHRQTLEMPVYSVYAKHSRMVKVSPRPDGNQGYDEPAHWAVRDLFVAAGSSAMQVPRLLKGINGMIYELDRPMLDRTGLDGYYSFQLHMPREPVTRMRDAFDAMEKQLGLTVEEDKIRTEMLVIDHLEK